MSSIKKVDFFNSITTSNGTHENVYSVYDNEHIDLNNSDSKAYINDNMMKEKIDGGIPIGLVNGIINSGATVVIPSMYALENGKNIQSLFDIIPDSATISNIIEKITSTKIGKNVIGIIDETYIGMVNANNKYFNGADFVKSFSSFGEEAFSSIAARTGAELVSPKSILNTAVNNGNIGMSAGLGLLDVFQTGSHYFEKGGMEEVSKHAGEMGGRFIGSAAGNLTGIIAGTTISSLISSAATGAVTGALAGSAVPFVGTIAGAVGGAVIGGIASTLLGDLFAEAGANFIDGG